MKIKLLHFLLATIMLIISGCDPNAFLTDDFEDNTSQGEMGGASQAVSPYTYNIPERYYSEGILNMVKRARQINEISWMPAVTFDGFNSDYYFEKGIEVKGIPYSQPVFEGEFVIYGISLDDFLSETKEASSLFYTKKGVYEEDSTYYGMDCSAFVSYTWNCRNRLTAKNLSEFGDYNGKSIDNIQVGDALIKTQGNVHAVLVTGIKEDSNKKVTWIEITEQTPPLTKQTRYGLGELYSLDDFLNLYLDDGYGIYRNTDFRDKTPYTHCCASPVDDECSECSSYNPYRRLSYQKSTSGDITLEAEFAPLVESENMAFTYAVMNIHSDNEKYITDREHYIKLRNEPQGAETIALVPPGTFVSIFDKHYDSSGELWGRAKYNGDVGWLYLDSSEHLGGEIWMGEEYGIDDSSCQKIQIDGYENCFKCVIPLSADLLDSNKKIVVFVYDSNGNRYKIGEYSK